VCPPRRRTVDKRELSVDPTRQERGVLVVRLHDETAPLEIAEVSGEGQRDARAAFGEGGVRDGVPAELLDPRDPGVFDSPELFRMILGVGPERRLVVDDPSVHAVRRSRRTQVRMPASVLDPAE